LPTGGLVILETPGASGWVVGAGAFCASAMIARKREKAAHNDVLLVFDIIGLLKNYLYSQTSKNSCKEQGFFRSPTTGNAMTFL
jgi:hypothetical protein